MKFSLSKMFLNEFFYFKKSSMTISKKSAAVRNKNFMGLVFLR
jgi:hypothetical protein